MKYEDLSSYDVEVPFDVLKSQSASLHFGYISLLMLHCQRN